MAGCPHISHVHACTHGHGVHVLSKFPRRLHDQIHLPAAAHQPLLIVAHGTHARALSQEHGAHGTSRISARPPFRRSTRLDAPWICYGSATVCMDGRRPTACIDGRRIARRLRCGRRRERQAGAHSIWSSSSSSPRLAPRTEPPCPLAARWLCPPCAVAVDGMCCARCMRSRRSLSIR